MRFSICIPNYNYGRYIGETIASVLEQLDPKDEICVSDNRSTDDSVEVIRAIGDDRVNLRVNTTNLGFAGNLDRAVDMASGDLILMLSSDDVLLPGAIDRYRHLLEVVDPERSLVGGAIRVIDSDGHSIGRVGGQTWRIDDRDETTSATLGADVYASPAAEVLRRSLTTMRNPLQFPTTVYPRRLYEQVGGYGGHQNMNPDKYFILKLLGAADTAYFVDDELAGYRWHDANQTAQQEQSGALKFLVDEYSITFRLPDDALDRAGLDRETLEKAFVRQDVALRGLRLFAEGQRRLARRYAHFGLATYPHHARRCKEWWTLRALLATGPVGTRSASIAMPIAAHRWRRKELGAPADDQLGVTWRPA